MHCIYIFILVLFVFLRCSSEPEFVESPPVLTDMVTLELSFGDEETIVKNEFLLAQPWGVAVNEVGDIFVSDEYKIKIFDENGKEKNIIGGQGEGPGEFKYIPSIFVGPTGFISAGGAVECNFYTPENKFIDKTIFRNSESNADLLKKNNLNSFDVGKRIFLSETESMIGGRGRDKPLIIGGPIPVSFDMLVFVRDRSAANLAQYVRNNIVEGKTEEGLTSRVRHVYLGDFHWDLISDNRVVYTHTSYDKNISDNEYSYVLHVVDLNTIEKSEIDISYIPVAIPDSVIDKAILPWGSISSTGIIASKESGAEKPYDDNMRKRLREAKYLPPVYDLISDRNYVFAFIYHKDFPNQTVAQVIDIDTENHISNVLFPSKPSVIKNGYAYNIKSGPDIFPVVEKYKINPKVYGK